MRKPLKPVWNLIIMILCCVLFSVTGIVWSLGYLPLIGLISMWLVAASMTVLSARDMNHINCNGEQL